MYSVHPIPAMSNGTLSNGIMDPAATTTPVDSKALSPPAASARGLKRSRSPDNTHGDALSGDQDADEGGKPRKRGRPPKQARVASTSSPHRGSQPPPTPAFAQSGVAPPVQTPQLQSTPLPQASPPQASPSKSTPSKSTVIKALPTVRDHTTDQLNPEGDEYIPREIDEAGERKVTQTGHPLDNREYRCRTFFVPNRGDKLFMLATECARVLGYRDSYLLFNKNRSLFKIIATQAEKDDLIHQEVLPYSYRSRQIAIVTARSMFRQFGSRLILNGRRVRDDYWENKARKQGFTEEDAAGEKRPGAAKAREAAAAEATQATALAFNTHSSAYTGNNTDYLSAAANPMQPFGGLNPAPGSLPSIGSETFQHSTTDLQPRDYSGVQRPRHEMAGAPYQNVTKPSPSGEILNQAAQTAEVNKQLEQQRKGRKEYLSEIWARPHEPPPPTNRPGTADGDQAPQVSQAVQSPRILSANVSMPSNQYGMPVQTPQGASQNMGVTPYRQQSIPQTNMVPSPMAPQHTPLRSDPMRRPPSIGMQGMTPSGMGPTGMLPSVQNPAPHGFAPSHMWQGPPQPSPLSQQHNMQQYAQRPPQQSPHPQPSPMQPSPQLHHVQSTSSMHGTPVQQYQTMNTMGGDPGYPGMAQNPYQPSPSPHQFMQHQTGAGPQPGMPGWAPQQTPPQGWQSY